MKVRVNSKYVYNPVPMDELFPPVGVSVPAGTTVRVINRTGAPRANVMSHCYIETLDGEFIGLVHTNSLTKAPK